MLNIRLPLDYYYSNLVKGFKHIFARRYVEVRDGLDKTRGYLHETTPYNTATQ